MHFTSHRIIIALLPAVQWEAEHRHSEAGGKENLVLVGVGGDVEGDVW